MRVFIQNERGSDQKHFHDEKTLEHERQERVSRRYPHAYGFIIGTTGEDGCNVDCFVLTRKRLVTGQILECEPIGLMEQIEDGRRDHNVLAVIRGENATVDAAVEAELTGFVSHVFDHRKGKRIEIGRFLGPDEARAHVAACRDE